MNRDLSILTRTLYGEARGDTEQGRIAIAWVVRNRAKHAGTTVAHECLRRSQFSAWNSGDPNLREIATVAGDDPVFLECLWAALTVLLGKAPDPTSNSRHYHTPAVSPHWAEGHTPVATIGGHVFYNDVN
jgi:spore germination cell wall hydrolase CwlJ-like protein